MKLPRSNTPLFLQQLQWIINPTLYLKQLRQQFGPIFSAMSDRRQVIFVSEPTALKQIFTNERMQFGISGEANRVLLPLIGPNSVLMLGGDIHKQRRQLTMPAFHQESMQSFAKTIQTVGAERFSSVQAENPVTMRTLMQSISLEIIEEVVFGLDSHTELLRNSIADLADLVSSPLIAASLFFPFLQNNFAGIGPYSALQRQIEKTDARLFDAIQARREENNTSRRDVLALLLAARDQEGEALSDQELRDELTTMLLAGHETTATAMTWAVYHICRHPEVKRKLLIELDSLPQNADAGQIFKLPYLTAVCNETLRLTPVVINTAPRVTQTQVNLNGFTVDADTHVLGCIYLLHQNEEIYPEPHLFRPERFIERNFSPFEFMPFGGGARRCLGEMLANFEMRLILAHAFSRYDINLASSEQEVARRRVVTLAPASGVSVFVRPRT